MNTDNRSDRFSAMRAAFTSQYNRRFVSAGIEATRYTHPEMLKSSSNPSTCQNICEQPKETKKKRSRWD